MRNKKHQTKKYVRLNHHDNIVKYKKRGLKNVCKSELADFYYDKFNYFNAIKEGRSGKLYSKRFYVSGMRGYCKKLTNKRVRKMDVGNYGAYRKTFDYWDTIF